MNYIIQDFSKWKSINEAEMPGKTKQTAGFGQRVVGIPIDQTSFKVKIIHDAKVLDANQKLTPEGWNSILTWIKAQPNWLPYYTGLGDLKTNFVVYSVNSDTERKQLITFTISPRASAPGLPAETQFVKDDDLSTIVKDAAKATVLSQTVKNAEDKKVDTTTANKTSSYKLPEGVIGVALTPEAISIVKTDSPIFKVIDDAAAALTKVPEIKKLPILDKVIDEVSADKLGPNSILFVKGVIAGFGLVNKYDRPLSSINQTVIDKIATFIKPAAAPQAVAKNESSYYLGLDGVTIFEQEKVLPEAKPEPEKAPAASTGLPTGFDLSKFTAIVGGGTPATGDIKLPEGGIKKASAAKGDETLKKVQQLIIDKLGKVLSDDATFIKFKGYGADGNYGPTTEKMISMAKAGFELKDQDGSVITPELVNKLQTDKITESKTVLEAFNVGAAKKVSSVAPTAPLAPAGDTKVHDDKSKTSQGKTDFTDDGLVKSVKIFSTVLGTGTWVIQEAVEKMLNVITALDNKTALNDDDIHNKKSVPAIARFIQLYSDQTGGKNLYNDINEIGTKTFDATGVKQKRQLLELLSKYKQS